MDPTTISLAASFIGQPVALLALAKGVGAWRRERAPVDLAISVTAALWLAYLLVVTALLLVDTRQAVLMRVANAGAQGLTVALMLVLMLRTKQGSPHMMAALPVYALAGTAALGWKILEGPALLTPVHVTAAQTWMAINMLAVGLFAVEQGAAVRRRPDYANWLAFAATMTGLALWIDEIFRPESVSHPITFTQIVYAALLLIVWRIDKRRRPKSQQVAALSELPTSSGLDVLSGFGPDQGAALAAVAVERRRIARDLHDNIGSQIANILASLDTRRTPAGENLALSLEQCLLDLKLTVDSIDSVSDSVPEALGRLRQRVQHSFDTLGIRLVWRVQTSDEFECTRGGLAEQVLRIAQECLTNVMRHSQASTVEVRCHIAPESRLLVLDIRDNGCGIPKASRHARLGKGLDNMRRRAESAGGSLLISSKAGVGTLVRLELPANAARPG